jgi:hypothetical protein
MPVILAKSRGLDQGGSTLFFVYTRSQAPTVALGEDEPASLQLRALRRTPAADVFLIKLAYWFDPVEALHSAERAWTPRRKRMVDRY